MLESCRVRRRVALHVAAVAAFSAATLPAPAGAEDGAAPPSPPSVEIGTVAEVDATLEGVVAAVVDQAAEELDGAVAAAAAVDAPIETEEDGSQAAPPAADAGTATAQEDSASTDSSEPDTTTETGDTAADSTAQRSEERASEPEPPPPPDAEPRTAPSTAVNLNVTVRIGSPGDDGAVVQTNTTAPAAASGAETSLATPRHPAATSGTPPTTGPADTGSSTWYWQWDCLSMPTVPVVSPDGSNDQSLPTSWTWIWNCDDNLAQYHSDSSDQYQQINNNVSIRISSPGENGAVTQTNVRLSVDARAPAGSPRDAGAVGGPASISVPSITVTVPPGTITIPVPPIVIGPPAVVSGSDESAWEGPGVIASDLAITIEAELGIAVVGDVPDASEMFVPRLGDVGLAPGAGGLQLGRAVGRHHASQGLLLGSVVSTATRRAVAPLDAGERSGRPAEQGPARRAKPAPRWTPSDAAPERGAPRFAPGGASASAAGAGGSPGGGLPIFLALPFLAVMLDLARRVALERATWPSGHRRRIPDTPG